MSGVQAPPRIRMFLPLTLNKRLKRSGACSATSDVISRMPNFVWDMSEISPLAPPLASLFTTLFTTNERLSSYRFGVPICAGHHSRGLLRLNCGYCAGEKTTAFDSPAPSSTACANSVFSILPWSIPFTGRSLAFLHRRVTVRWAALVLASPASESTVESTAACRSATGPLVVKYTSRHTPMFLSGGEGFQIG